VTTFAKGENWACYIDKMYLPGKRIYGDGTWDPEGILSTLPAVASCLLGVLAGLVISNPSVSNQRKLLYLIGGGILGVLLGFLWGCQFPVIKKIWTSSYVLVAGGYSGILLGLFYLVVDIWKLRLWARPFVWIGSNALTVYLAVNIWDVEKVARRFAGGDVQDALGRYGDLALTAVTLGLVLALARFLYRKRIFIRV
jgi:predicted acyltransferase